MKKFGIFSLTIDLFIIIALLVFHGLKLNEKLIDETFVKNAVIIASGLSFIEYILSNIKIIKKLSKFLYYNKILEFLSWSIIIYFVIMVILVLLKKFPHFNVDIPLLIILPIYYTFNSINIYNEIIGDKRETISEYSYTLIYKIFFSIYLVLHI